MPTITISGANTAVAALALSLCFIIYGCYKIVLNHRFYNEMPGPPHSLIWGHMGIMRKVMARMPPNMHSQSLLTEIARMYDLEDIFYLDLWPLGLHIVVLNGPALIEQALAVKRYPQHPLAAGFIDELVGKGALAGINGPIWKKVLRAVLPACSWANTHALTHAIADEAGIFGNMLARKAASGEAFSLEKLGGHLIFDVLGRVNIDIPLNAQTSGSPLLSDVKAIIEVAEASMSIGDMINPWKRLRIWWRKRAVYGRLDPVIRDMIQKRSDALARGEKTRAPSKSYILNVLDLLVEDFQRSNSEDMRIPPTAEQRDIIMANVKSFLLAAAGSTTTTFSYLFMLLSKSPRVLEEVRREHARILGPDINNAMARILESPEILQSLTYSEAVCKEALRLFPVGISPKLAGSGETISLRGERFPIDEGRLVFPNGHDVHYNPRYFPDPTSFLPERWLDGDSKVPKRNFLTFALGPRVCGGQNIVFTLCKIALVMTIRDYDFECADCVPNAEPKTLHTDLDTVFGDCIFQKWAVEAKPRGGMMMTVKRREWSAEDIMA